MTTETIYAAPSWKARLDRTEELLLTGRAGNTLSAKDAAELFQAGVKSLQICHLELSAAQERLASLIALADRRSLNAVPGRQDDTAGTAGQDAALPAAPIPLEASPCPLCGADDIEKVFSGDRYDMGLRTARCRRCGFLHTNPRPAAASLNAFYRGPYRGLYKHPEKPSLPSVLAQGMQNRAHHTVNALASAGLLPCASLLDAGCGEGSVLRELGERYGECRLHGVEPDPSYAAFASGYAGCGVSQSLEEVPGEFSAAAAIHVLEHILDPVDFLRRLSGKLAPEGRLYIEVPDAGRYVSIQALHLAHLNHFTADTLLAAGRAAGLHALEIVRHDPPFNQTSLYAVFALKCPALASFGSITLWETAKGARA